MPETIGVDELWGDARAKINGRVARQVPFSTTIPMDSNKYMPPTPATASMTLSVSMANLSQSGRCVVPIVGNGNAAHVPTIQGAVEIIGSRIFETTNGVVNLLLFEMIGGYPCYQWLGGVTAFTLPDLTSPSISSVIVNGAAVTITWSENLANTPLASAFSVVGAGGVTQTPTGVSQSGAVTTLTLASPAMTGNTVTISVNAGAAQDAAGNSSAAVANAAVTNFTGLATPITLVAGGALTSQGGETFVGNAAGSWNFSRVAGSRPSGADATLETLYSSSGVNTVLAFDNGATLTQQPVDYDLAASISGAGLLRYSLNNATWTNTAVTLTPSPTTRYRIKIASNVVTLEYTTNDGANWTVAATMHSNLSATLCGYIGCFGQAQVFQPRKTGMGA